MYRPTASHQTRRLAASGPARRALALAAAALLASPSAWSDAVVSGQVSLVGASSSSFAGGTGNFLHPSQALWVGFAGTTPAQSANGSVTFNGGTQASFRSITTAQPQDVNLALPLPDFNVLRVQGTGTRVDTQGVSTGYGSGDIYVTGGGVLDARSTACADASFGFFFCSTRIGEGAPSRASLEVSGAGSLYQTRALSIASAGTRSNGQLVAASVDVFNGGTLRSWNIGVASGTNASGTEQALGIVRINGNGSRWIVDGYDSAANGAAPANFTTAPHVILGRFSRGTGQLFIENGGNLHLEKKDAASGAPFIFVGFGGSAQAQVTGVGSSLSFQAGTAGSLLVGAVSGGTGALQIDSGGQASGMQYVAVGRARYVSSQLNPGGTGTLLVDGAGSLLRIDDRSSSFVGQLDIARGGDSSGTATVRNGGRIEILAAQARTNGPTLMVGREPGEAGAPASFTGNGVLNIQGAGSVVQLRADNVANAFNPVVRVGRAGTGTGAVNITAGGQLLVEGLAASTVAAPRNTSLVVGGSAGFGGLSGGNGSMLINGNGSAVVMSGNDRYAVVGDGPGAVGQLTISGGGSFTGGVVHVARARSAGGANGTVVMNGGHMLLNGRYDTGFLADTGSGLLVGADSGAVGSFSMTGGSTLQVLTSDAGRSAAVAVGGIAGVSAYQGGTGSLVLNGGSSILIDGAGSSRLTLGGGGSGSLTMNASQITLAANGRATFNGSALLSNGSSLDAGSYLGVGVDGGVGSLLIHNSSVEAGEIVIGSGGFLGGSGATVTGNVTNHGVFSPGASPGTFTILGNYTAAAGSQLILEVESDGAGGFRSDRVIFGGTVDLSGVGIEFRFLGNTSAQAFADSGLFQIDHFLQTSSGAGLADSAFTGASFTASAGGAVIAGFSFDPVVGIPAVPEPQTWALMLVGAAALASRVRRQARPQG